jgi:hypothetical protein
MQWSTTSRGWRSWYVRNTPTSCRCWISALIRRVTRSPCPMVVRSARNLISHWWTGRVHLGGANWSVGIWGLNSDRTEHLRMRSNLKAHLPNGIASTAFSVRGAIRRGHLRAKGQAQSAMRWRWRERVPRASPGRGAGFAAIGYGQVGDRGHGGVDRGRRGDR